MVTMRNGLKWAIPVIAVVVVFGFLGWLGVDSVIASSSNTSLGSSETPNSSGIGSDIGADDEGDSNFTSEQDEDYILFAPLNRETAYLINLDGDVVHDWELSGRPGNAVYLLEGGDLLATYTVRGRFNAGGVGGGIELLAWDGEEVWSFELATGHAHLHHDVEMLPNSNVLMIAWEAKTRQETLAAGLTPRELPDSGEVWSEMILEYDPSLDQVVWEWHLWDHVLPEGQAAAQHPEKIDLDFFANPRSEDWWHLNAVDYSEDLDQIVLSSRAASEIWIIDHDLTTAEAAGDTGDLLYRFGNPAAYGGSGEQALVAQHDAKFLDDDTILVFDNGDKRTRPYSRVLELDLPDYENAATSSTRVLPAQIVWQYPPDTSAASDAFFSDHISGAQRLENDNTLICSGTEGRFFEVTPSGEIVWEYVNPFTSVGRDGRESNEVFRALAYSAEYIGQSLASLATPNSQMAQHPTSDVSASPPNGGSSPDTSLPAAMASRSRSVTPSRFGDPGRYRTFRQM